MHPLCSERGADSVSLLSRRASLQVNQTQMSTMGVTHIVNCTSDVECHFPTHFTYKRVPVTDAPSEKISEHFASAFSAVGLSLRPARRLLSRVHRRFRKA